MSTGSREPPSDPPLLIDGAAVFFIGLAAASALLVLWLKGPEALLRAGEKAAALLMTITPMIIVGLFLGGLVKELSDPRRIAPVLGTQSGARGLILATMLGAATPGGPFAAFPIVYALWLAGADLGAVVAYLTAWSVLGLHRVVIWELPLLGHDFVAARFLASLPLPVIAGLMARTFARLGPDVPVAVFAWRADPGRIARAAAFSRKELVRLIVRLPFALMAAACIAELIPERAIAAVLGAESGLAGIAAASVLGGLLPGGPIVSFPLAILFAHQGAGGPQVIALITGWSVYAFHRVISFESPIMGWPFVGLRLAASWFVPPAAAIMAGLIAAALGLTIDIP